MTDTDRAPLDGLKRSGESRHRFWRFDPTVSTGTLLQLGAIAVAVSVGYATYREDRTQTRADIEAVKVSAARDREEMRTAIDAFRGDFKELKTELRGVSTDVAVLRSQTKGPAKP